MEEQKSIEEIKSHFNTDVPEKILTPSTVETRLGTLKFDDGLPSEETTKLMYDNLDFMRGTEVFLNGVPATSLEGACNGMAEIGVTECNHVAIFDKLMDSNSFFLTGNTDTVYANIVLDLEKDGPIVVEVPAGCGPGTVNDAFFRFVVDMGGPGPDRGKGGKYLILPPDYDGEVPEDDYFVATSTSYVNAVILRGFLVDGKPDVASQMFREGIKVYPLKDADNQPEMKFVNASHQVFNTIHANDFAFYEELNAVIQREPVSFIDPELRGLFASIGIQKGKEFAPDERMKAILTEAAAVGNATARALVYRTREDLSVIYKDKHWESAFVGGNHEWLKDDGTGGRFLDARTRFFYCATVNTPAMVLELVGLGSQYGLAFLDKEGKYLLGDKNYVLHIPANVPVEDFWSVVIYDPQTRSELQTGQQFPSVNSKSSPLEYNEDGSVDLYFGPTSPEGKENNWIETNADKCWFAIFRAYGPLEPWFDQSWQLEDITLQD